MSHRLLMQREIRFPWLRAKAPIRREEKQQVVALTMALAKFEHRLPARNIIASVAVDKHEPSKTVSHEILRQSVQQIQIRARRRRQRAGEIQMMIRISQPHQ